MLKSPKVLSHRFTLEVVVENLRSLFKGVTILHLKWILVVIFHNSFLGIYDRALNVIMHNTRAVPN